MATQNIPLFIPTFIGSINYDPVRVLPRLLFYNGQVDCQAYWLQGFQYGTTNIIYASQFTNFPYFDHYNVVSGSFPTTNSRSLLYNNENAAYGEIPTQNLYTTYWSTYVSLLYNPKTRLLNASAIIPLADYFNMELNDVVNFRGNYYHLRAINDYSVKTGECNLQLLGPIIPDTFYQAPIGAASSSVSWSYTETQQDGEFKIYDNAINRATLTANGSGSTQVSESHYVTASLVPVNYPSSGSILMSLRVNGATTIAVSSSANTTISASFLAGASNKYNITGSILWSAASSSVSWSYTENLQDGEFKVYDDATTLTTLTANGTANTQVTQSHYVTASLAPVNFPSTGSVTMSLNINGGGFNISRSTSINETISASFLVGYAQTYSITASTSFTQLSSSVSWSYTETSQNGEFKVYDNAATLATLTANGTGNSQISQSHYVTASLVPVGYPGAGVTMSINVNGGTTLAVSASTNTTLTASFLAGAGQQYGITGSITYNVQPPDYVTGSYVIYDFGYVNSYPGSGSTVYDVSGNGITGSLINSPTYSSVKGGSLSFDKANSQRIEYSGSFPQAYTVQAFFELSGSNNLYPGIGGQFNNNGMVLAIDTQYTAGVGGTYQIYYYGGSGNTSSGAKNNASSSPTVLNNNFVMYSATNDGTNTVKYYINTGSVSTQSNGLNRTLFTPTNQVAYIGYDPAGTQYVSGKLVAWLVYPSVLTAGQITQNYNIFNAR
jgi:hypothetical protein